MQRKKRVSFKEVDLSEINLPKTPARRREMLMAIKELAKEGYKRFATQTYRCLNHVESPDADPPTPKGWEKKNFYHDCIKKETDTGVYNDIILLAQPG